MDKLALTRAKCSKKGTYIMVVKRNEYNSRFKLKEIKVSRLAPKFTIQDIANALP